MGCGCGGLAYAGPDGVDNRKNPDPVVYAPTNMTKLPLEVVGDERFDNVTNPVIGFFHYIILYSFDLLFRQTRRLRRNLVVLKIEGQFPILTLNSNEFTPISLHYHRYILGFCPNLIERTFIRLNPSFIFLFSSILLRNPSGPLPSQRDHWGFWLSGYFL